MVEIENNVDFLNWLSVGESRPTAAIQGLFLQAYTTDILGSRFKDSLFLSCDLEASAISHLISTGAHVVPNLTGFEFPLHRPKLYSPMEIFAGFDPSQANGYEGTFDYKVYKQYSEIHKKRSDSIDVNLARRLHDHSISDALYEQLESRKVVAVMGGHGMERSDPFYYAVAKISRALTKAGFLMISGGGPGAMEATHLGAYFAQKPEYELTAAIDILRVRPANAEPEKEYNDPDWLHRAWRVLEEFPLEPDALEQSKSIGIPTWLYGHEPPAVFATHIAKYFANSVREDNLLMVADHGVIYAPGSAGTTQEIFQDAAQNHYGSSGYYAPMVLLGEHHWTHKRPVWPLLKAVSAE